MYDTDNLSLPPTEKPLKFKDYYNILHTSATTKAKTIKTATNSLTMTLGSMDEKKKSCFFKCK